MKIGFDAKRLFSNYTGLGNYSRTLVRNLQNQFPEHEYHLYVDRIRDNKETRYFLNSKKFVVHQGPKYFKSVWRAKLLVNDLIRDKIDIFHGLSNELPYGIHKSNIKSVVTIHDLIFKAYPRQYKLIDRQIYNLKSKYAIRSADKVVAISNATKESIIRYYNTSENKINIIYQSCAQSFLSKNNPTLDLKPAYSLPKEYFLYVGSIIERKGLMNIAIAVKNTPKEKRIPIVIVGNGTRYLITIKKYLDQHNISNHFQFLKSVSNADLKYIYNNALALIYPSLMEGFGIPIIEAGLMRTPIISSNRSSLPEAGGPDIIQINPEDPAQIIDAMFRVSSGDYTIERSNKVYDYINTQFDHHKLSQELMNLYKSL